MAFTNSEILVFDRSGARIGALTGWTVTKPRTYRLTELEDMSFMLPQRDSAGDPVLTPAVNALLARDNLVFIDNEVSGMRGWAGAISEVDYRDGAAWVSVLGGLSLLDSLDSPLVEESGGTSDGIANSLLLAANGKKAAHGDVIVGFQADGSTPNYGSFEYEGNVLQGLFQLAEQTFAEFWIEAVLAGDAQSLGFVLHWDEKKVIDYRGTWTLTDGVDGNVQSGASALYSGLEVVNRARLRGASTDLAKHVDYSAVSALLNDITPEVDMTVETPSNFRRREELQLSVSFGYSDDVQRALAQGIQQKYVDYYKTFLYALHNRRGKPFLEGYDWNGPSRRFPERKLTETDWRTINQLGRITQPTIIATDSAKYAQLAHTDGADIDQWEFDRTIAAAGAIGMAQSYQDPDEYIVLQDDGMLYTLEDDGTTLTSMYSVESSDETAVSVATDTYEAGTIWVAATTTNLSDGTSGVRVKAYDVDEGTLLSIVEVKVPSLVNATGLYVDAEEGLMYLVGDGGTGNVWVRQLGSGLAETSYSAQLTGTPVGISGSGGLLYVTNTNGKVSMLYASTGNLAAEFSSSTPTVGIFVDPDDSKIFMLQSDGSIDAYDANVALAVAGDEDGVVGAPGFDNVVKAQFVHIVMTDDILYRPWNAARFDTYSVQAGDTLWSISKMFYGVGTNWRTLYRVNRLVISEEAVSRGLSSTSHRIFAGTLLRIPGQGGVVELDEPANNTVRYLMCYTKGWWVQEVVPGPIGEPDILERQWKLGYKQIEGTVKAGKCPIVDPAIVIFGEEGRVNDWDPKRDGYGLFVEEQRYRTRTGYSRNAGAGWYPRDWDIPDSEWVIDPPEWPEGELYLQKYLERVNQEITVQSFSVTNRDGLWNDIELGGVYTFVLTTEGDTTNGISVDIRVLGFSPSEYEGTCELVAEVYLP